MLNVLRGSTCKATDFVPESFAIEAGAEKVLVTTCGRSSHDFIPFLELNLDDQNGYLFVVGWTGSWKAWFADTGKAVEVEIGMERTEHPGERGQAPRGGQAADEHYHACHASGVVSPAPKVADVEPTLKKLGY